MTCMKTGTLVLILALAATGLMGQYAPPNPSFDLIVNPEVNSSNGNLVPGTGTPVAPGGQLPNAEHSLGYQNARVVFPHAANQADSPAGATGHWGLTSVYYDTSLSVPAGQTGLSMWQWQTQTPTPYGRALGQLSGIPHFSAPAGTYSVAVVGVWTYMLDYLTPWWTHDEVQYYTIEIVPAGSGTVYPPAPGTPPGGPGGGDDGGGKSSSSSCSTVPAFSPAVAGGLVLILGALAYRRRRGVKGKGC